MFGNCLEVALRILLLLMVASSGSLGAAVPNGSFEWQPDSPENQGMLSSRLHALRTALVEENTKGLLIIRNDRIVYEWYAEGHSRQRKHYTASMAKALVGGVALAVAMSDDQISLDEPAARFLPQWRDDPLKSQITIRHLGSHTSGIQDAWVSSESVSGIDQQNFSGWEGQFWQWRSGRQLPPNDSFSLSRDRAPVLFRPGTAYEYSNPGMAMLSYVVTASLKGTETSDTRTIPTVPMNQRIKWYWRGCTRIISWSGQPMTIL